MSVRCPDCGAVVSYGTEIGHRIGCGALEKGEASTALIEAIKSNDRLGCALEDRNAEISRLEADLASAQAEIKRLHTGLAIEKADCVRGRSIHRDLAMLNTDLEQQRLAATREASVLREEIERLTARLAALEQSAPEEVVEVAIKAACTRYHVDTDAIPCKWPECGCTDDGSACDNPAVGIARAVISAIAPTLRAQGAAAEREKLATAAALVRYVCQRFDSAGESQRSLRSMAASAAHILLHRDGQAHEEAYRRCDDSPPAFIGNAIRAGGSGG